MPSSNSKVNVLLLTATGVLGSNLANGLLSPQYSSKLNVSLLVRKETATTPGAKSDTLNGFVSKGAKVVHGDISNNNEDELVKLLNGIDVIVSAVGATQFLDQLKVVTAAKKAGVKWFIPSEFGYDTRTIGKGSAVPILDHKIQVVDAIKSAGLNYTIVTTGVFGEFVFSPFFGVDAANHIVTAPGSFDSRTVITPLADIGLQLADIIANNKGRNETIYLGTANLSFNEIHAIAEQSSGQKFEKKIRTVKEAEQAIQANQYDYAARFVILLANGKGTHWPIEQTYAVKNGLKYETIQDFAKNVFKTK